MGVESDDIQGIAAGKRIDEEYRAERARKEARGEATDYKRGAGFIGRLFAAIFLGFAFWIVLNLVVMILVFILAAVTPLNAEGIEGSAGDTILIINGILAAIGAFWFILFGPKQ